MALTDKLTAIADSIRDKTGKTDLLTLEQMPAEIASIETGGEGGLDIPEETLRISGSCGYMFVNGKWDWFIEMFGDQITTEDITSLNGTFNYSKIKSVPFELNMKASDAAVLSNAFKNCSIETAPKINNLKVSDLNSVFENAYSLREIPEDFTANWNWSDVKNSSSSSAAPKDRMVNSCYSLREFPLCLFSEANPKSSYIYSHFYYAFHSCVSLNEIKDIPIPYTATWTSNAFSNTFNNCFRLKGLTFEMPNGQPKTVKWKSQTIDLSSYVGYANSTNIKYITDYNSGITGDKRVTDDASYQALKDDPDWWTTNLAYSRFNHDSAVALINSLPDASAYLASSSGTNTVKFKKGSGSKTDGGAVDNLTEEEIAVATAKGWTISLVS